jgi:hypothetical protein
MAKNLQYVFVTDEFLNMEEIYRKLVLKFKDSNRQVFIGGYSIELVCTNRYKSYEYVVDIILKKTINNGKEPIEFR